MRNDPMCFVKTQLALCDNHLFYWALKVQKIITNTSTGHLGTKFTTDILYVLLLSLPVYNQQVCKKSPQGILSDHDAPVTPDCQSASVSFLSPC